VTPPSIQLWPAHRRFHTETDRMSTRHSFSFGAHYDPGNVAFGRLLVNNDDVVRPGPGYDPHPHADAEIVTWVLSGSLVHEDSAGHRAVVHPGVAQRMSAGAGIVHAERNDAYRDDPGTPAVGIHPVPVHFVQMWLRPDVSGGPPAYQQRGFDVGELSRGWVPIASGAREAVLGLGSSGSTLWAGVLQAGQTRAVPAGDHVHLYVARGAAVAEGLGSMAAGDSLRLTGQSGLRITATVESEMLVWEMAA
jgi:redox-sensitive bicupin YhaK (pirin superfamily)